MPSVVYVLPSSELHGGIRVVFEHAEGLAGRGYDVLVVGPDPAPTWHETTVPYRQVPIFEPGAIPRADLCIGTFYTTLAPVCASGTDHPFHLCQGYEGVHREYAPILHEIDVAYRLPTTKLLISAHLAPVLNERYGVETHLLGQAIDCDHFTPGEFRERPDPLRVGVVGPFGLRPKGIGEALLGLRMARDRGVPLEIHHASSLPLSREEEALKATDQFYHRLSTDEMVAFYQRLDLLVHPSHDEEGFPLPPLEAMACGVPVALTRIRSFAVLPDDAVVRYPYGEPEALVPVIDEILPTERRRGLRDAGLRCARGYTLDALLDRLEEAFEKAGAPRA
ncbi:MAG: glycosyltransferase family 4 protein [Acidobacteriota bacterium]